MKKNLLLYILVLFLIVVNAFFLVNYLSKTKGKRSRGHQKNYIVKQLQFNEAQIAQFRTLEPKHRERMRTISHDIRALKDELFDNISNEDFTNSHLDSITSLIAKKEKEKDIQVFNHFRAIETICNEDQKKEFKHIIKKAMRTRDRGHRPPKGDHKDGPPPPRH